MCIKYISFTYVYAFYGLRSIMTPSSLIEFDFLKVPCFLYLSKLTFQYNGEILVAIYHSLYYKIWLPIRFC